MVSRQNAGPPVVRLSPVRVARADDVIPGFLRLYHGFNFLAFCSCGLYDPMTCGAIKNNNKMR